MLLHWEHVLGAIVSASPGHDVTREFPLVTSLCYYAITLCLGRLLRSLIGHMTKEHTFIQSLLYDFVTSFEMMAMSLENGQLRKHYGENAYIAALFVTGAWTYYTVDKGRHNPCTCVVEYMQGCYGARRAVVSSCVQLCGGLLSYQYARAFWSLGLTRSHWQRYLTIGCRSDLTVTSPLGFGIEFAATLLSSLLAFNSFSSYRHSEVLSKCVFGAYLTILGIDLTGMYLNPINATNQTFGCHGPWLIEFFLVYWIAPLTATALAVRAQNELRPFLKRLTAAQKLEAFDCEMDVSEQKQYLRNGKANGVIQRNGVGNYGQVGTDEHVTMLGEKGRHKKRFYVPSKMK